MTKVDLPTAQFFPVSWDDIAIYWSIYITRVIAAQTYRTKRCKLATTTGIWLAHAWKILHYGALQSTKCIQKHQSVDGLKKKHSDCKHSFYKTPINIICSKKKDKYTGVKFIRNGVSCAGARCAKCLKRDGPLNTFGTSFSVHAPHSEIYASHERT